MTKKKRRKTSATKLETGAASLEIFELDEIDQACKEIEDDVIKWAMFKGEKGTESLEQRNENTSASVSKSRKENVERNSREQLGGEGSQSKKEESQDMVMKTVGVVIEHLNKFGACVIDNFLGEAKGLAILEEVLNLNKLQMFQAGQLASAQSSKKSIRSDKIAWTDGISPSLPSLKYLINTLDSIVIGANQSPNNGVLSKYSISSRTKAMVACYPGEGTHYVKHVDNPNKDGRCITAIYYLNRDWDPERDGGALKIYSACVKGVVAQVDPLFDRIIFFWSDRRNPHEVLPAFRERYAITVWYMDEKEKRDFEEKKRLIPEQEEKS
eukprot:GFUD01006417.1.p1 GENE.GFUD01006417.1~~GFUD01006417.1.p1  ORF type:complete len:326 (+),score=97.37 GFUD01006417.1:113-1090(+)